MKISVLVPVFNVEDYLAECIESVITQTYKDVELILVNDGSTDQSPAICDQYALWHPKQIVAIHTENRGALHARAKAMEKSTGDVLVFLDADDCLRSDALELIAQSFVAQSCDMVLFNTGECKSFQTLSIRHLLEDGEVFDLDSKGSLLKKVILKQIPNSVCLKAVRACCADIPDRFYRYHAKHGEDLLLSVHFMTNCKKIVYLNEGLYHYRDRLGSIVHSFNPQRKESIKVVHTELEHYIDQWGLPELKPLHNTRKVQGWIDTLRILLKNRNALSGKDFREQLRSMATDPYFRNAYGKIVSSGLSHTDRILAFCLINKQYLLLHALAHALHVAKK